MPQRLDKPTLALQEALEQEPAISARIDLLYDDRFKGASITRKRLRYLLQPIRNLDQALQILESPVVLEANVDHVVKKILFRLAATYELILALEELPKLASVEDNNPVHVAVIHTVVRDDSLDKSQQEEIVVERLKKITAQVHLDSLRSALGKKFLPESQVVQEYLRTRAVLADCLAEL